MMFQTLRFAACSALLAIQGSGLPISAQNADPPTRREAQIQQVLQRFPQADAQRQRANQGDRPTPTFADVAYGPHARNVLDFYQVKSDKPTPLVIYIHGGGFVGGNKNSISPAMIKMAQAEGISMAALHYRFVNGTDTIFPAPQHDCARAVQFLRSKASDWNIDPKRVACYGGSAGAGISMWLGFHDDLADPDSDDPVARQSTRISAIGTMGGQGTYDPIKIKELVGGKDRLGTGQFCDLSEWCRFQFPWPKVAESGRWPC